MAVQIGRKKQVPIYDETTTEITGYEEKILPQNISNIYLSPIKKVTNGWIKTSSGAKQFYPSLKTNSISYSGNYTQSVITIDGVAYDLFALTTSGTLTAKVDRVWVCGGGGSGANGLTSTHSYLTNGGGGGGGGYSDTGQSTITFALCSVTIGAGGKNESNGGSTSIAPLTGNYLYKGNGGETGSSTAGGNGGSGGGAGANKSLFGQSGKGQGSQTYPFGVTSLKAHCAGGGGGGNYYSSKGRAGGTNGADGTEKATGAGGEYGGGNGGIFSGTTTDTTGTTGSSGTFYGAGGGGGSCAGKNGQSGGAGYQGIVYLLIKK